MAIGLVGRKGLRRKQRRPKKRRSVTLATVGAITRVVSGWDAASSATVAEKARIARAAPRAIVETTGDRGSKIKLPRQ